MPLQSCISGVTNPIENYSCSMILPQLNISYTNGYTIILFEPLFRNLVSGHECGRAFSAGVWPGSPSRDAANWLSSRFSLSVETRWRYGWLRMVFPGARLFRAPIWGPSGEWRHARSREHCRGEPGSSLSGGYTPDSAEGGGQLDRRRARGGLNPCARESQT